MRKRTVLLASLVGVLLSGAAAALADGEPYFVKKDTWLETLVAAREALARQEAVAEAKVQAAKEADEASRAFQRAEVQVSGPDGARQVRVRVAGLKKVFIGASGPRWVCVGDLRLVGPGGAVRPVDGSKVRRHNTGRSGNLRHDAQRDWRPMKVGERVFDKGVMLERAEIEVDLDGQVEQVEMWVGISERAETRPTRVWVDWCSNADRLREHERATESIPDLIVEAFPDQLSLRQRRLEEAAGVWAEGLRPGDWAELASRYARSCGKLSAKARELAGKCKGLADVRAVRDLFYVQHAERRLGLAERTLAFVQRSAARPVMAAELDALRGRLAEAEQGKASGEALYARACELRRKIILSHPLLDFDRLLIDKRTGHLPEHMCDQYLGRHSQAAPGLVVLDHWKDRPRETLLLEGKLPRGATLQPSLSYDGRRVVFAFADHSVQRDGRLRGYYIYEYSFDTAQVRQITGTERDPMRGRNGRETVLIEDTDPCYLPDGGVAFISTRSQQYGRCHGGRYVPAYTLYRAETDGSGIRPLSFNESNEWAPNVQHDGTIVYCRWDYVNRHDTIFQSLWAIHPDGTQTAHYYGNFSRSPCMISEPQPIPNSHKTVCTAAAHHGQTLGTIIVVDPYKGQEDGEPLTWITPEAGFPEAGTPKGITRTAEPLGEDAGRGRAATPWPISEDLFLCTYQHGPGYAIYLVDTLGGRELIYCDPKISCFDPIPLRPRPMPPALPSAIAADSPTGVFYVQDVYQSTQPIPRGSAKRMRINEIISQTTRSVPQRSAVDNEVVKRILGTVPVNEDGSVAFEAPASTPMQFQLLDADGMAVMTMRSLVYLQPGERASCIGCHEPRENSPAPAPMPRPAIRTITPPAGPRYEGGFSFMRTVQPVLDRYCIGCHGPANAPRGIDLTGGFARLGKDGRTLPREGRLAGYNVAYESLLNVGGLIRIAQRFQETYYSKPNDYFAHASRLAPMLLAGHPDKTGRKRLQLDAESLQRIVDWLDLNAQFYGDYSFNRVENQPPLGDGEKALRQAIGKRFGPELAGQPFAMLVNVANVPDSRILMAPLPTSAGGWGQIEANAFGGKDDPAYKEFRGLVEASIKPLEHHDVAATCGRDQGCRCGNCWVRTTAKAARATGSASGGE